MSEQAVARITTILGHVVQPTNTERELNSNLTSSNVSPPPVLFEIKNNTAIVTLNRPESLNALNVEIFLSLRQILQKIEENPKLKVIILRGEGRGYCAGGDIKELSLKTQKNGLDFSKHFFTSEYSLDYYASRVTKCQVVFWNGIAMGGGLGISMYSKYKVATEKSVYAMPEVGIGLFPDVGGSYFLSRMPWPLGLYLGLSTARLDGADLLHFGVATHYINSSEVSTVQNKIIELNDASEADVKKVLDSHSSTPGASTVATQWKQISEVFSLDSVEAIFEALQKDQSDWAQSTLKKMMACSPTSLKVTFQQIHRGKNLDVLETFKQEYRLALRFMQNHDFFEGVRAMLIDKKSKARWNPDSLEKVKEKDVEKYFAKLESEFLPA